MVPLDSTHLLQPLILALWKHLIASRLVALIAFVVALFAISAATVIAQLLLALRRVNARVAQSDEEAQQRLDRYRAWLSIAESQVKDARNQCSVYRVRLKEQRTQIRECLMKEQSDEKTIRALKSEIYALETKLSALRQSLPQANALIARQDEMDRSSALLREASLRNIIAERDSYVAQLSVSKAENNCIRSELDSHRASSNLKLAKAEETIRSLNLKLTCQGDRIRELLQTQHATTASDQAQGLKDTHEAELAELRSLVSYYKATCDALEGSLDFSKMEYFYAARMYEGKVAVPRNPIVSKTFAQGRSTSTDNTRSTPAMQHTYDSLSEDDSPWSMRSSTLLAPVSESPPVIICAAPRRRSPLSTSPISATDFTVSAFPSQSATSHVYPYTEL